MIILDGKAKAQKMREEMKIQIKIDFLDKGKKAPTLVVVLVGQDSASVIHVRNKEKACNEVGINSIVCRLKEDISEKELLNCIEKFNNDNDINGILVQLPLPENINPRKILNAINTEKDVDALSDSSIGKLVSNSNLVAPCTPVGVIELLKEYNISLESKYVVIVGRSFLVGRPMELLCSRNNATTTVCNRFTKDLGKYTSQADILIVAAGSPKLIKENMVKRGAIVIDIGTNNVDGKLCGDVDFEAVKNKVSMISPVPGGVGPMTIAGLLKNTLILAQLQNEII